MVKSHLLTGCIIVLTLLTLVVTPVQARDPLAGGDDYHQNVFRPAIKSPDVNLQSTVYEIYLSLVSSMNESIYCFEETCLAPQPQADAGSSSTFARSRGLIPQLVNLNATVFDHQPISSTEYIADVRDNLNLGATPAYAQGIGFQGLEPVYTLWVAFRNIAYLVASIGFIFLAFMVMFRIRAGGQAVVTAQSSIIKFIVVVLAITLSYPIAGFIIDLIYVFNSLIIMLFRSTGLLDPNLTLQEFQTNLLSGSIFQQAGSLLSVANSAGTVITNLADDLWRAVDTRAVDAVSGRIFGPFIGGVGSLIIGIAIIWSLFRLLIQLLFAYLEILLLTVMAPFLILLDIFPGGSSFMNWMRRIFANAMIFPATVFMILLGIVIVGGNSAYGVNGSIINENVEGLSLPYLTFTASSLAKLLGVGFILIIPKVNEMVKGALKVSQTQYASAVGQAVGVGAAPAVGTANTIGRVGRFGGRWARDKHLTDTIGAIDNKEKAGTITRGNRIQRSLYQQFKNYNKGSR